MRLNSALSALVLVVAVPAVASDSTSDRVRVVGTPTGCAVILDSLPDEYRVDSLVNGGVVVGFPETVLSSRELELPGTCLSGS